MTETSTEIESGIMIEIAIETEMANGTVTGIETRSVTEITIEARAVEVKNEGVAAAVALLSTNEVGKLTTDVVGTQGLNRRHEALQRASHGLAVLPLVAKTAVGSVSTRHPGKMRFLH